MNLVLLTSKDCSICEEAEKAFREKFKEELESGEADVVDLEEDEQAQQIWQQNDLPLAPVIIVISDGMKVASYIDGEEFIKKAKTGTVVLAKPS